MSPILVWISCRIVRVFHELHLTAMRGRVTVYVTEASDYCCNLDWHCPTVTCDSFHDHRPAPSAYLVHRNGHCDLSFGLSLECDLTRRAAPYR